MSHGYMLCFVHLDCTSYFHLGRYFWVHSSWSGRTTFQTVGKILRQPGIRLARFWGWKFLWYSQISPHVNRVKSGINTKTCNPEYSVAHIWCVYRVRTGPKNVLNRDSGPLKMMFTQNISKKRLNIRHWMCHLGIHTCNQCLVLVLCLTKMLSEYVQPIYFLLYNFDRIRMWGISSSHNGF